MDLPALWKLIEADIKRAIAALPSSSSENPAIRECQEFLGHNELEMACVMLEEYANDNPVNRGFWIALSEAAKKMDLLERAERYSGFARAMDV